MFPSPTAEPSAASKKTSARSPGRMVAHRRGLATVAGISAFIRRRGAPQPSLLPRGRSRRRQCGSRSASSGRAWQSLHPPSAQRDRRCPGSAHRSVRGRSAERLRPRETASDLTAQSRRPRLREGRGRSASSTRVRALRRHGIRLDLAGMDSEGAPRRVPPAPPPHFRGDLPDGGPTTRKTLRHRIRWRTQLTG
jgi:hypothetical protein